VVDAIAMGTIRTKMRAIAWQSRVGGGTPLRPNLRPSLRRQRSPSYTPQLLSAIPGIAGSRVSLNKVEDFSPLPCPSEQFCTDCGNPLGATSARPTEMSRHKSPP
jgi:hypothetical protein